MWSYILNFLFLWKVNCVFRRRKSPVSFVVNSTVARVVTLDAKSGFVHTGVRIRGPYVSVGPDGKTVVIVEGLRSMVVVGLVGVRERET